MSQLSIGRFGTVENALSTGNHDVGAYVWTSVLLTGLLTVCVPVVGATTGLPTPVLVVAVGVCYLAAVTATRRTFEGLASAVFVLSVFDITVTLVDGPGIATVDVVAVDVVAVPLALFLLYKAFDDGFTVGFNARSGAVFGFTGSVCWTFAAGFVANGGSRVGGLMMGIEQLRYLVVFVVAALVVARTNAWCAIYPFVVATAGNLVVSLAQIANGGMLGFPFLGEPPDRYLQSFMLGSVRLPTGFYAGGFVGHGRELAMVLLMFIPLVVAVAARRPWLSLLPTGAAIAASVLSIRVADTDAGWATLVLLSVFFGVYLIATLVVRVKRRYSTVATLPILVVVAGFGTYLVREAWLVVQASPGPIPVFQTNSLDIRLKEYAAAVRIALQHPFFGIGGNNFYIQSTRYVGRPDVGVHNTLLSHLAATGFVGFALYLLGVVAVLVIATRLAVATTGTERLLWVAMVAAMCAFHAYSSWMSSYSWTAGNTAFWLLAGVTVGAATRRYHPEASARLSTRFTP